MKITIDTANDSKEELRKLISMLQSIVGEKPADIFTEPAPSEGIFNMFGEQSDAIPKEQKENADDVVEETFKLVEY